MAKELAELWRFRFLLWMLVDRELKVRYKNSVLGFFWSLVPPLLTVVTLTYFFRGVMKVGAPNYPVYLLCGIIPWTFFTTAVLDTSQSLLTNYGVIKKIYLPREIIPISIVLSNFVHFLLGWLVFFAVCFIALPLVRQEGPPMLPTMLWFPVIIFWELLLTMGVALWCSALNVFYEDVKFILQTLFSMVYFFLPILYPAEVIRVSSSLIEKTPWIFDLYMLNPITAIITAFRHSLLHVMTPASFNERLPDQFVPIHSWYYVVSFAITVLIAWSGYTYFNHRKWRFVERS